MVTAKDVKELRERTGAGMMDCKKALTECEGNMDKAIDWLREKGIAKAAKKSDRIAAEGLSRVAAEGNTAVVFPYIIRGYQKSIVRCKAGNSRGSLGCTVRRFYHQ